FKRIFLCEHPAFNISLGTQTSCNHSSHTASLIADITPYKKDIKNNIIITPPENINTLKIKRPEHDTLLS
ncbi:hypothetical protein RCT55_03535, partial [Escherichia coli]|nr:hypothetical protein [Escherichia coli]